MQTTQQTGDVAPASSGSAPTGVYADLTLNPTVVSDGNSGGQQTQAPDPTPTYTGTATFPGIVNAPTGTIAVSPINGAGTFDVYAELLPNDDEWLPAGSPFGQVFGGSGPSTIKQFLRVGVSDSLPDAFPSLTVVDFAKAMPAGSWGFAIGDIDVDLIRIDAFDAAGRLISGALLNGGVFNYCDYSPTPLSCVGDAGGPTVAASPLPTWDAATSTCFGNGDESTGATCWFRPSADIKTLKLYFGLPTEGQASFRLWMAALKANIAVGIGYPGGNGGPPVLVDLFGPDGQYLGSQLATGGTSFDNLLAALGYVIKVRPPAGYDAVGGTERAVNLLDGDAFELFEFVTPTPDQPVRPPVHPQSGEVTLASFGTLPTTGSEPGLPVFFAVVMLAVGAVLLRTTRRRLV